MRKSILYIGNNLIKSNSNPTTIETLSFLLEKEGFLITKSSDKKNKIIRFFDMVLSVLKNRNKVDFILIDTYSTFNFYYALIISQIARFFNIKYIPILHGGNLTKRLEKSPKLSKLIFKNSYKNVSPSNFLKSEFDKFGYKTVLIPNVIEIEKYKFKSRKELSPKLLYVRAFAKIYNPTMAIKVLKEVQKKYASVKLCMVGPDRDGSLQEVKDLIKKLNLESVVEITGVLSKEKWHKKSEEFDIFINTTNIDNTPVSVIEAMALGLPIVSTNVGGIPYLINHKKNGILVEKDNFHEMKNSILAILEKNPQEMILNARKSAESFSWENVKSKWINLLQ